MVHDADQRHLHACQLDVGRQEIHPFLVMKHPFSMRDRSILYDFYHEIVQRNRQFVRLPSKAEGQASLSVCIDEQHLPARLRQPYAQVGAGRRFGCAALLVGKADNVRIHPILPFFFKASKKPPIVRRLQVRVFYTPSSRIGTTLFSEQMILCIIWRKNGVWRILPKNKKA